jgi:hypothetical protein
MHVVDLLEEAIRTAMDSGCEVRQEWLNENGGGMCRIGQRQVLFVDLSLTAQEQLEHLALALQGCRNLRVQPTSSQELKQLLAAPSQIEHSGQGSASGRTRHQRQSP